MGQGQPVRQKNKNSHVGNSAERLPLYQDIVTSGDVRRNENYGV